MLFLFDRHRFDKLFVVHGLKRCGNHAILNWVKAQGVFRHFNDIIPLTLILKGRHTPLPILPYKKWVRTYRARIKHPYTWKQLMSRNVSLIASLEDHDLSVVPFTEPPANTRYILILRDPVNCFASRIRKGTTLVNPVYPTTYNDQMKHTVALWKQHAREFLGETRLLPQPLCIYYNAWVSSPEYRKHLASQLGFQFTDAGFLQVPDTGRGSSFDGTAYNEAADQMQVLQRAALLNDHERALLDRILDDHELTKLAAAVEAQMAELFASLTHVN